MNNQKEVWTPLSVNDEAITLWLKNLSKPLHWLKKSRVVYLDESVDIFDDLVPDVFIDRIFSVIALSEKNIFKVLTKNPQRMLSYFKDTNREDIIGKVAMPLISPSNYGLLDWPIQNVDLGVIVDDQKTANERVPLLLKTPAAYRWVYVNHATDADWVKTLQSECENAGVWCVKNTDLFKKR